MPLFVCKKLDLGEIKPTNISTQLANRSVKYPVGILKDVPIRIGKLYIPTNFVIMEIEEDSQIPILLGRPFLAMIGAIVDVKRGRLTFQVWDKRIEFILSKIMKNPSLRGSCCLVDIIDVVLNRAQQNHVRLMGWKHAWLVAHTPIVKIWSNGL